MSTPNTIQGTDEAWENGELGRDTKYARPLTDEEMSEDIALVNESLGLQPISIRLEKSLIDDFKAIATINGLGYQTLMRQALKRFADCEKKSIVRGIAAQMAAKTKEIQTEKSPDKQSKHKNAA